MVVTCIVVALLLGTSCRSKTWQPPVRITAAPWVGNTAMVAAQEKKQFAPLDVRIIMLATDFDGWRAVVEKRADMFAGTVFDMIRAVDQGVDVRIVMALDFSSGADGIIAKEGITKVEDLRGKKIAVERATTTHFVLLRALERAGMKEDDVVIENIATDAALQALDEGRVDAAALWDPFLARGLKGGRKLIFTTAEIPGEVIDVLGVRADLLQDRSADVDTIVRGIHNEVAVFGLDQTQAIQTIASTNDLSLEVATRSFDSVHFVTAAENNALFARQSNGASIWTTYALATSFLEKHKMLRHPMVPAENVIDGGSLARVAKAPR